MSGEKPTIKVVTVTVRYSGVFFCSLWWAVTSASQIPTLFTMLLFLHTVAPKEAAVNPWFSEGVNNNIKDGWFPSGPQLQACSVVYMSTNLLTPSGCWFTLHVCLFPPSSIYCEWGPRDGQIRECVSCFWAINPRSPLFSFGRADVHGQPTETLMHCLWK